MLKKLLRCLITQAKNKRQSKQSKRPGKQSHPQSTKFSSKKAEHFGHTTQAERKRMFELRQSGQSVHAIAKALGRSSRTVHQVLTERGTQPLPEPEETQDIDLPKREEGGRY